MRTAMLAAAVTGLLCLVTIVRADEEKVALDKLPKEVTEAVKKRFPNGNLLEAAKETENGKTTYEVTVKDNGKKIDVTVTPDGKLQMLDKEVAAKDLPKSVRDAIEAKYPKSTIKLAEEVIKVADGSENLEYYEAVVDTVDKKTFEVQVAAEWKITKTEEKTGKKD